MRLRPIRSDDINELVEWNNAEVPNTSLVDRGRFAWLVSLSRHALVAEVDDKPGGFVLTIDPGTTYDSKNYLWFSERFGDSGFIYLDRVVVAPHARRRGLASLLYDAVESDAAGSRVLLEVTTDPPNEISLAFHRGRGYRDVGVLGAATMFELPLS